MKEQAQRENRNFVDIVAEKYGLSICALRRYVLSSQLFENNIFVLNNEAI